MYVEWLKIRMVTAELCPDRTGRWQWRNVPQKGKTNKVTGEVKRGPKLGRTSHVQHHAQTTKSTSWRDRAHNPHFCHLRPPAQIRQRLDTKNFFEFCGASWFLDLTTPDFSRQSRVSRQDGYVKSAKTPSQLPPKWPPMKPLCASGRDFRRFEKDQEFFDLRPWQFSPAFPVFPLEMVPLVVGCPQWNRHTANINRIARIPFSENEEGATMTIWCG